MSTIGLFSGLIKILGGSDGTVIGNAGDRLKVDTIITASPGTIPSVGNKLRYVDMNASSGGVARLTSITNAAFVTVFQYSGSGVILNWLLNIEDKKNWTIRFIVDGEDIFPSPYFNMADLSTDTVYDLDEAGASLSPNEGAVGLSMEEHDRVVWTCPSNFPIRYATSVEIQLKRVAGQAAKKFQAGLITLTKDT